MSPPLCQLWINGAPRPASNGKTFDVINSATGQVATKASSATLEDVHAAIIEADKAQPGWEAYPVLGRRAILLKAAELLQTEKYLKKVTSAVTEETAALPRWGPSEVGGGSFNLQQAAFESSALRGENWPSENVHGGTIIIEKRAYGTIFAIAPFNAPVILTARAVGIPLICGNAVVLKSSEMSPRCTEVVVEALYEAGLPKGVLNLIHVSREDSPKLVAEIIGHKLIRHINFTGSDRVGRIIASEAGKYLKPCVFELGGKSASIVFDDADIQDAAENIMFAAMEHGGQICMSTERVIVQRGASKALMEALTTIGQKIRPGTTANDHIPPLITEGSAERIVGLVKDAKSRGGDIILGDIQHKKAYIKPHIVVGVEPGWPLWEQESFGPVLGLKVVDTEEEAIALANMTDYSLMGSVWTNDLEKALRVARQVRAGQININGATYGIEPTLGIHGLGGATGYGNFDVENFTQKRILVINPRGNGKNLPIIRDL